MTGWLRRLIGILIILTAVAVTLSRAPDRPVETLVARWAPPPSEFIDVQGQLVHLRDEGPRGDSLPIVLIHGTSASLHTWEGWVKALRPQRRVISFDLPGFGLTGPSANADYRGDTYARFVLQLMDHLQVQRFIVGGNSLGGEVAWRTAHRAPERVERLILVDALGLPFESSRMPVSWQVLQIPLLGRISESLLPRPLVAQDLVGVYGSPEGVSSELVDRYFELALREGNRRALAQRLAQWEPGADAALIDTLKLPTLILWGGRDRLIPPPVAQEFQRRIAGSQLVMFERLGHVPQEEDPAATVAPVLAFIKGR